MRRIFIVVLGLFLFGAGSVIAGETTPAGETKPSVNAEDSEGISAGEKKVIAKLALRYKVPEQDIVNLRTQNLGYGEISHALAIAGKTGEKLDVIIALKTGGMGWGEITKKYDLNLGKITKEAKNAERLAGRYGKPEKNCKMDKMEKPGKPEKLGKPEKPAKPGK